MKIYLDNCCLNRPFDVQNQMKVKIETEAISFILESIAKGNIELVWSYMIDYENSFNPFQERRISIESWKQYSQIDIIESNEILYIAEELNDIGIKAKDSLHIAAAVISECNYFVTTDSILIKKLNNNNLIKVINPVELIILEDI